MGGVDCGVLSAVLLIVITLGACTNALFVDRQSPIRQVNMHDESRWSKDPVTRSQDN